MPYPAAKTMITPDGTYHQLTPPSFAPLLSEVSSVEALLVKLSDEVFSLDMPVSGSVEPGSVNPGVAVPGSVVPGFVVPGFVVPGSVVPGFVAPGSVVPGFVVFGLLPPGVAPGFVVPGFVAPGSVVPGFVVLGLLPPGVVPGFVVPGFVVPGFVVPGFVVPGFVVPGFVPPGVVPPGGSEVRLDDIPIPTHCGFVAMYSELSEGLTSKEPLSPLIWVFHAESPAFSNVLPGLRSLNVALLPAT